jgi:hypothetical protein
MRTWSRKHPLVATVVGTVVALAAVEAILVCYFLNSWFTMPLL